MGFEEWFKKKYLKTGYVSSKTELEEAWNAALDEAVKVVSNLNEPHKDATNECETGCDYVIAWGTAAEAIKELK